MKWKSFPIAHFSAFAGEWDELAAQCAPEAPFLRSAFVEPLLKHFSQGNEKLVAGYDDQLCAAAILRPVQTGIWETFQPSQLPLGALLAAPGRSLADLSAAMLRVVPGIPLSIGITQVDPLLFSRPIAQERLETIDYIETAWVTVDGTFEAYWEGRGKNLRHNIRKQRSKLSEQGIATRLETLTAKQDVAQALHDYGALESAGWKASGGTAIHPDNAQGRFYKDMLEAFCSAGEGRLYRYWFGDKLVAVDLCITGGSTLVILKTTYDEALQGFSPAFLMRHEAFSELFREKRIRRIEFYGKMMEWHKRWTEDSRTLYHATRYRWNWLLRLKQARARRNREPAADAPAGTGSELASS